MKTASETFAFRLAKRDDSVKSQWKAREGGAVAGCTEAPRLQFRYASSTGSDNGVFC